MYVEQKIIRTGKLDDLSADELEAKMKTIIDQYSPIIKGESTEIKREDKELKPILPELKNITPARKKSEKS